MTHICPMTNDAHFNKEGFLESPTEDDPIRIQCLDFDCYCGICDGIYKEAARDAAEEMSHEPPEDECEDAPEFEETFPIEVDES